MNTLNMLESIYRGCKYSDTLSTRLDRSDLTPGYKFSRVPIDGDVWEGIQFTPYKLTLTLYKNLLSRCELGSTPCDRLEDCVVKYSKFWSVLSEPRSLDDLMVSNTDISIRGLIAFLYMRCYGDEQFRRYINSTILKDYYIKRSSKKGPPFYVAKGVDLPIDLLSKLASLYPEEMRWKKVQDSLLQSYAIFSWRD